MQANKKNAKGPKEIDYKVADPSDAFNSVVSEGPISNDNLDCFIKTFSELTELN